MFPGRRIHATVEDGSKSLAVSSLKKCTFIHDEYTRCYSYPIHVLSLRSSHQFCLLVPGGLAHPAKGESCICADLDGGCLRLSDSLLHRLHQVLGVVDQHLCGLVREK